MELRTTELEVADGIATIWLNRPERMNAWTGRMHTEYRWCLKAADERADVRVIVVTGRGRAFCVGGDSKALQDHAARGSYDAGTEPDIVTPGHDVDSRFDASFAYHFSLSKPVIAALNGPAAGVGLALACFADLRFAAKGVKFTTAHGKLNLPAEYGLSWLLPRMMGLSHANDLLLSSRVFLSDEAAQLGMVNSVHETEALLPFVYDYAHQLRDTVSPESLRQSRWQIYRDLHGDIAASVKASEKLLNEMMQQPDYREGIAAFIDKRPPRWGSRN
ncbi:MAG: enoyl-CoA hydratase-related protein [Pseudomonadales bacterium]